MTMTVEEIEMGRTRLFLVTDDNHISTMVVDSLTEIGYEVSTVPHSVEEARKLTRKRLPHIFILDSELPLSQAFDDDVCLDLTMIDVTQLK
jgi:DNA-binding response OmpR family regulator